MCMVVLYDANASVCALLTTKLEGLGLKVVSLPNLEACEPFLRGGKPPLLLILDLSRHPGYLPVLQAFVPRYIPASCCVLTSLIPTALADFLPQDIKSCFFEHVVERPFKTPDFIRLLSDIVRKQATPPLSAPDTDVSRAVLNSSVRQITGPTNINTLDKEVQAQVEAFVSKSQNNLPPLRQESQATKSSSGLQPPPLRPPPQPQASLSPFDSALPLQGANSSRPGRVSRHAGPLRTRTTTPTLSPPPDPVQASSAALSSKGRGPARHRAPTCLPPSERELGVLHAIESAHDEDGESTIVVSALSDAVLPAPSVFPKQALISGQYTADVLIHILKFSRLMGQNMALEVTDAPRTIVLLVDAGRAAWGEILTSPNVQGYSEFLRGLAFGTSLSAEAIEGLMHQGLDMLTAVTSLGMQPAYFSVCERFIMEAITTIQALHGKPYAVYEGIPERYHRLQTERPALGIDVSQQVFDLCRTGQDTMSVPNAFRFAKFVARPHRTPWNASIQLNPQETSVQASLQSPTALERIQSHDALPLPGLLYRLVLFEFVDVAMGVVDQCCRIV